jgi:hypothetical protein
MWATHQSLNKDGLLEDLHPSLKLELTMCVNEKLIKDVRCHTAVCPQDGRNPTASCGCTAQCVCVHALHSSTGRHGTPGASRCTLDALQAAFSDR